MGRDTFVQPEIWYAQLPKLYAAAGALLTDTSGRVLLVKPHYRDHWTVPGGNVDVAEPPHHTCAREIHEELGLINSIGRLLVVDWAPPLGKRPLPIIYFLFDCGTIGDPTAVRMHDDELDAYDFFPPDEAAARLASHVRPRLPAALAARSEHTTHYLANAQVPATSADDTEQIMSWPNQGRIGGASGDERENGE